MRLLTRRRSRIALPAALLWASLWLAPLRAQDAAVASGSARRPSPDEIHRALERVKADPNLAATRTIKMLRWNDPQQPRSRRTPAWLAWIAGLLRWIEQSSRVLIWAAAAVLAGFLGVYIVRLIGVARAEESAVAFVAPTHVRDLDIRPETLPGNIGLAARALWDRGDRRAALALLYRGLLSRLAHVHRLPIRDSTTEGDCLMLAGTHLSDRRLDYTAALVRVWQRSVYGGEEATAAAVYDLCDGFAAALDPGSPRDGGPAASGAET